VWPDRVVVLSPLFDEDLGLRHCLKDLTVQQLVAMKATFTSMFTIWQKMTAR
tara:strand:- start:10178 stop:10333 length:156 start_codon:yes stop_codon:yes gene_type:complete